MQSKSSSHCGCAGESGAGLQAALPDEPGGVVLAAGPTTVLEVWVYSQATVGLWVVGEALRDERAAARDLGALWPCGLKFNALGKASEKDNDL